MNNLETIKFDLSTLGKKDSLRISVKCGLVEVKRHSRGTFVMFCGTRSRWGTLDQIAEDFKHVLDYETMPAREPGSWS